MASPNHIRWLLLSGLAAAFLAQPLARALNRVVLKLSGDWALVGFLLIGALGIVLLASYLYAEDSKASVAGFLAGLLIWRGFFDGPLRVFAGVFELPPIDFGGFPLSGRYALLMSSVTMMIALLALYGGLNRETRCYFLRWTFRAIRWSPGHPTPDVKRSTARITAMETIFVQWGVFLLFLFFGGWLGTPFYIAMLVWAGFLIYRLLKHRQLPLGFRYGIPVSVILWSVAEVGAFFGWYEEFWQEPFMNPWSMLILALLFALTLYPMLRVRQAPA